MKRQTLDVSHAARRLIMAGAILTLAACNLANNAPPAAMTGTPASPPQIRILQPANGDEFVIGEEILVSVEAEDSIGVNRVQLFANDQIVRTVASESLQGDLTMQAILNYVPQAADEGTLNLRVAAYRAAEVSPPDEIEVIVRESRSQTVSTPGQAAYIPDDDVCRALINVGLNFRQGPSTAFPIITVLNSGALAPVVGRLGDSSWWQLNVDTQIGWVSAEYTTAYGDCSQVVITGQ